MEESEGMKNKFEGMSVRSAIKEADRLRQKAKSDFANRERELALMEAGLTIRPYDRDFYELQKLRHEQDKEKMEMAETLFGMLRKAISEQPYDPKWDELIK